jgi:hypothetical protein
MQRSISLVTVALGLMTAAGAMPPQQAAIRPSEGASTCCAAGPCTASSAHVLAPVQTAAARGETITIEELVKRLGDPKQREATLQAVRTKALRVDSGSANAVAKAATTQAEHALHAAMAQTGAVDSASIAGQATRAAMPAIESALRALETASTSPLVVRQDPSEREDADEDGDDMIIEDLETPDAIIEDLGAGLTLDSLDLGGWSVGTPEPAPEPNTEPVEAGQSHDHDSLEERITALERLARKRAYAGAQALDDDHDKKSLEERVAELERILRDPANANRRGQIVLRRGQPGTPLVVTPRQAPAAPRAAVPPQPPTPRAWGGMGYVNPDTMSKIDEKVQRKLEEAHRRLEEAQRERETVLRQREEGAEAGARARHAPRAGDDNLRGQMESLMHDMRAQMDSMREEMARMRAELERMPRHESR